MKHTVALVEPEHVEQICVLGGAEVGGPDVEPRQRVRDQPL